MDEICNDELKAARAEAIEKNQCFSKGRLRDEFRMKPKPDAEPVAFYKNGYGGEFGVYKISDCVPMKARSTKPPRLNLFGQCCIFCRGNVAGNRSWSCRGHPGHC